MSVKAISWAWENGRGTAAQRLVLLALADSANDDGECWPGMGTIAKKTGVSVRSVHRAIGALEQAGLVEVQERRRSNGSYTSHLYRLTIGHSVRRGS